MTQMFYKKRNVVCTEKIRYILSLKCQTNNFLSNIFLHLELLYYRWAQVRLELSLCFKYPQRTEPPTAQLFQLTHCR